MSLYHHMEGRGKSVRSLRSSSKAELVQGQPVQCESLSQNKKQNPSPYCPAALSPAFHPKTHVLCLTTCVTLYKLNAESPWLSATMNVNYVPIIRLFRVSRVLGMASLQGPWSQVQVYLTGSMSCSIILHVKDLYRCLVARRVGQVVAYAFNPFNPSTEEGRAL